MFGIATGHIDTEKLIQPRRTARKCMGPCFSLQRQAIARKILESKNSWRFGGGNRLLSWGALGAQHKAVGFTWLTLVVGAAIKEDT